MKMSGFETDYFFVSLQKRKSGKKRKVVKHLITGAFFILL